MNMNDDGRLKGRAAERAIDVSYLSSIGATAGLVIGILGATASGLVATAAVIAATTGVGIGALGGAVFGFLKPPS